jgi:hypothetical protein
LDQPGGHRGEGPRPVKERPPDSPRRGPWRPCRKPRLDPNRTVPVSPPDWLGQGLPRPSQRSVGSSKTLVNWTGRAWHKLVFPGLRLGIPDHGGKVPAAGSGLLARRFGG